MDRSVHRESCFQNILPFKCGLTSVPISFFILAQLREAVALCEYYCWLEDEVKKGHQVTEVSASEKLETLRK